MALANLLILISFICVISIITAQENVNDAPSSLLVSRRERQVTANQTGRPQPLLNLSRQTKCVAEFKTKHPRLTGRFDDVQIAWWCDRGTKWQRRAEARKDVPQDSFLTKRQRQWLFGIRTCNGKDCLLDESPKRKKPTLISGNGVGTRTDIRTRPPSTTGNTTPPPVQQLVDYTDKLHILLPWHNETDNGLGEKFSHLIHDHNSNVCRERKKLSRQCVRLLDTGNNRVSTYQLCELLLDRLNAEDKDWQDLAACGNRTDLTLRRSQTAKSCMKIMLAEDATDAFPDLGRRLQRIRSEVSRNIYEEWLQERYDDWLEECSGLQELLGEDGKSLEEWVMEEDEEIVVRHKRQSMAGGNKALRKEYRMLSDSERKGFQDALNRLKTDKIDGLSKYDLLVIYHTPDESPGAHWGPAFLPFHREWIKQLETALRQVDSNTAVPYWDSSLDEGLPSAADSILWSKLFLGNGDGETTTGPFANWPMVHELSFIPGMKVLFRDVGASPFGGQYTADDVEFAATRDSYEDFTACVDPTFELVHGVAHMFIGGYMADIGISPNDPSFFLHHSFIDSLWENWRQTKQTRQQRETDYPTDDNSCSPFHEKTHQMQPFPINNADGLSNKYTDELYEYAPRPTCSAASPDCASPYLFCKTTEYRCLSKIRPGGSCSGLKTMDCCYGGTCDSEGRCDGDIDAANPPTGDTTTIAPTTTTTVAPTTTTTVAPTTTTTVAPTTTTTTTTVTPTAPTGTTTTPTTTTTVPTTTTTSSTSTTTPIIITTTTDTTKSTTPTTTTTTPTTTTPTTTTTTPTSTTTTPTTTSTTATTTTTNPTTTTPTTTTTTTTATTTTTTPTTTTTTPTTTTPNPTTITTTPTTTTTTPTTTTSTPTTTTTTPTTTTTTPTTTTTTPTTTTATPTTTTTTPTTTTTTPTTTTTTPTTTTTTPTTTTTSPMTTTTTTTTTPTPTTTTTTPRTVATTQSDVVVYGDDNPPPFPTVFFTLTIIKGSSIPSNANNYQPVSNAVILATGKNLPMSYTQSTVGTQMNSDTWPNYVGGAFVQVMDPARSGRFPMVEFEVSVRDGQARVCQVHCKNRFAAAYSMCSNRMQMSSNSYYGAKIAFRKSIDQAKKSHWAGSGAFAKPKMDHLLFLCPE